MTRSQSTFKTHPFLAAAIIAAGFGLQGWMLNEISALKERVAALTVRVELRLDQTRLEVPQSVKTKSAPVKPIQENIVNK